MKDIEIQNKLVIEIMKEQAAREWIKEQIINAYFAGFKEGRGIDHLELNGVITYKDTNAEIYYEKVYII